jgi:hypothetical protein
MARLTCRRSSPSTRVNIQASADWVPTLRAASRARRADSGRTGAGVLQGACNTFPLLPCPEHNQPVEPCRVEVLEVGLEVHHPPDQVGRGIRLATAEQVCQAPHASLVGISTVHAVQRSRPG